jgi:hypothetical protein
MPTSDGKSLVGNLFGAGEIGIILGLPDVVDRVGSEVAAERYRSDAGAHVVLTRAFCNGEVGTQVVLGPCGLRMSAAIPDHGGGNGPDYADLINQKLVPRNGDSAAMSA